MTNQEWLATLPAEECAKLLDVSCDVCVHRELRHCDYCDCTDGIAEYLKQEHKEVREEEAHEES